MALPYYLAHHDRQGTFHAVMPGVPQAKCGIDTLVLGFDPERAPAWDDAGPRCSVCVDRA